MNKAFVCPLSDVMHALILFFPFPHRRRRCDDERNGKRAEETTKPKSTNPYMKLLYRFHRIVADTFRFFLLISPFFSFFFEFISVQIGNFVFAFDIPGAVGFLLAAAAHDCIPNRNEI